MIVGALGVSKHQVRDALLEGNAHGLGVDALRMLTQIVLTSAEELKLKYFKDDSVSRLCHVEAFVKAMLDVFHNSMSTFLRQPEEEILKIQSQESSCLSSMSDMAEYFHGDSVSDEARMFRIFLAMLDRICREAGAMDSHCVGANWIARPMESMTTA